MLCDDRHATVDLLGCRTGGSGDALRTRGNSAAAARSRTAARAANAAGRDCKTRARSRADRRLGTPSAAHL